MDRIAIVSSPRSGNTWIRSVVAGALGLQEIAVHNYLDAPEQLPERCLLQVHWYREPNFQKWLKDRGFRVLVVARNPLDVLLSALRFCRHEPQTSRWLEGNVALPEDLGLHSPASDRFLDYALSNGAEELLSISYQWWRDDNAIKIRYEDFVADPLHAFTRLVVSLQGSPEKLPMLLEANSLEKMRATPTKHGWMGQPELYKKLIPYWHARKMFNRHARVFEVLGYPFRPYFLTRKASDQCWGEIK